MFKMYIICVFVRILICINFLKLDWFCYFVLCNLNVGMVVNL